MIGKGGMLMAYFVRATRKPSTAAMLSMLSTGLGHVYCGRFATGLALFFTSLLPVPFAMAAALSRDPSTILLGVIVPCFVVIVVYLYAIAASYRLAKRIGDDYQLRDYNRGVVYVLFIVAGILYPAAIATHIRANVFEAFYCPAQSMSPTLLKGDHFLVNKLMGRRLPRRGDIIVFLAIDNRDTRYVKRVIGLPGDTVALSGNEVYVNGRKLEHQPADPSEQTLLGEDAGELTYESNGEATYRVQLARDSAAAAAYPQTKVPEGHCFVLGDNRPHSLDSRRFGFVPFGDILGKAQYIYFPAQGWSRFGRIGE